MLKGAVSTSVFVIVLFYAALQSRPAPPFPGLIAAYENTLSDQAIDVDACRYPGTDGSMDMYCGQPLWVWPSFRKAKWLGGKFDDGGEYGNDLPEYLDLEWRVRPYPYPPEPKDPAEAEKWYRTLHDFDNVIPVRKQRVLVKSRIPQSVLDEAQESAAAAKPGQAPEKRLWIHFIWHRDGIWFRWRLATATQDLRSGGDIVPAPYASRQSPFLSTRT